ncbi:molybdopterin-guanine dinucleotide biosynthesis protein A [Agromyces albus]|nr:molybdopterin-guanine dinucleotide biosynthesis protein A [Agromyces albus]
MEMRDGDWAAIVLAGGRGSRLGGRSKAELEFEGRRLLDRALDAMAGASAIVVVGAAGLDDDRFQAGVRAVSELPRWGGPAAALAAGLAALPETPERVVVLAVDLPRADEAIGPLLAAATGPDGCVAVDADGVRQPLLAVYRAAALRAAVDAAYARGGLENLSLRRVLAGLDLADVALQPGLTDDVDTPDDAARAGIRLRTSPGNGTP